MGSAIELPDARMLCDTANCGHVETVNPREVRKHVGAQRPRCSAVMVTEETALRVEQMIALVDLVNVTVGPVEPSGNATPISVRVDVEGDVAELSYRKPRGAA